MTTNKKETGKFVSFCSRGLAVLALCGSMLTTVAQDFTTKQAAPKSRVINLKGATADRLKQADKAAKKAVKAPATLAKHKGRRVFVPWRFVSSQMPTWSLAAAATVETTNANGIITSPAEGVRRVYTRSGMSYRNGNGIETVEQSGAVHIVECTDGTVYVHNILSGFPSGAWVKGTRQGNTITIPSKQPIYFNGNTTFSIRWGVNDEIGFSNYDNYNGGNFTFTVDDAAGTLTLENSSEQMFMGLFWDDDDAFAYQGDYETVWTYESDFQPLPVVTITPPEGLETEKWFAKGHYKSGASDTFKPFVGTLSVGFYGQEVYLQGVFDTTFGEWQSYFEDLPSPMKESWMKGTIDGDVVTFSGLQFAGTVDGLTSYTVGTDGADLTDFIMTWDAEQKVLKSQNQLLLNSLLEDIGYSLWLRDLTIQVEDPNKPIDTLPYANGFESEDEWERFRVIDANHDDSSWQLYSEEDNQEASYKYSSDNDADDWLISPVIRLEAGKTYSFAIDARCSSDAYSERVEVALLEQLPSPLMPTFIPTPLQTIIEPTELQTELPLTLANKFVTVSETGYYQFGIHAISDADHASLRVDNLLVGETIMTAPAAVTDLAVTAADESPVATITFTAPTKNIGGGDLTANLTHVDLLRDNVVIKSFEDVAPGTALTYTDDDEELIGTTYTYMVVAYNADGEGDKSAMVVDNIRIVDLVEHNLTAELSAPATVQAGKTATIKATVTNWGEQAAKDFTVVITAGDEELLRETVADELAPFAKLDFDAELATTIFDEAGDRAIRLQVDYAADLKPTDNNVETTIAVVDSDVPAPTNLMAKSVADGVELNWTAPDNEPVDYTEAFDNTEAFPTFGIGGITATQHEGSMADWTLYDGNGSDVYSWGSEGIDYENRYQPSAWMAFDIAKAGFTNETGHSGAQVMLSMCPVPGEEGTATATDHWLISPELPGTEQLISFYLRAITNQYGSESFEVLASKTDSKPESFELVESFVTDEESWNEFTALLPEGTKYFAIRHTSTDVFGVMLDDVTFNYAGKMSHYNVYCQGQLIASVEDGTTTYTVAADELPEGECIFAVTAVYANGQESKPATINVTTDIRQLMADGQPVDVYTIDGKQLRRQVTTLDGLKGIYVVNGRTVVIK